MVELKKVIVLIVDDEPDILELIEEEFRYCGYQTLTASCGNDAIKILDSKEVDIVVSDFKMPNGNGMLILNHINSMARKPLFFFVSGQADVSTGEAIKAGARNFFSKPFDLDELMKQIEVDLQHTSH